MRESILNGILGSKFKLLIELRKLFKSFKSFKSFKLLKSFDLFSDISTIAR